jgi:hypothetical protein
MGDGARRPADAVAPRRSALIAQEPFDLGGEIVPARELLVVGLLHPFEELAHIVVGCDRSVEARTLGVGVVLELGDRDLDPEMAREVLEQ